MNIRSGISTLLCLLGFCSLGIGQVELMPLAEVKPGMQGVWKTSVTGTKLKTFRMRVLGISENFMGPQRSVIICEALDAEHRASGPVGGMSGSPVYIDGKLIGAYAYGFTWQKDQAILGVTPIHEMLGMLGEESVETASHPSRSQRSREWKPLSGTNESLSEDGVTSLMKALPTPVMVGGISTQVLDAFGEHFDELNMYPVAAPVGASVDLKGKKWARKHLEPGMPVAGVLMHGDFSLAATGTITWRDGARLLAFGHPFQSGGACDLPMAGADILTIVKTYSRSFKLSNIGPVVGRITQDRVPGVVGEVGVMAPTTRVQYELDSEGFNPRIFNGELLNHKKLSPLISAVGLLEVLSRTVSLEAEQTVEVTVEADIKGCQTPLRYTRRGDSNMQVAADILRDLSLVWENRFALPDVQSLSFRISRNNGVSRSSLDRLQFLTGSPRAGDAYKVAVSLRNHQKDVTRHMIEVEIPKGTSGENLRLYIGDAPGADELDSDDYTDRSDFDDFEDIIRYLNGKRSSGAVYLKLLRKRGGLRINGETLEGLPRSVVSLYEDNRALTHMQVTDEQTVWEGQIEVNGVFSGSESVTLQIQ